MSTSAVFPSITLAEPNELLPVQSKIFRWRLSVTDDASQVLILGEPEIDRSPAEHLRLNVTVRLCNQTDRLPPHLNVGNESIVVDVSLSGRNDERFVGVQLAVVGPVKNSAPSASISTINICNDEVMPGIFRRSTAQLGENVKLQWKPLAFTTSKRDITQWVGSTNQRPNSLDVLSLADYNNSALRVPVCPVRDDYTRTPNTTWVTLINHTFSLTVRDKFEPVDRGLRWLSWSMVVGFGVEDTPREWSLGTALLVSMGFGTPSIAIIIAELRQIIVYGRFCGLTFNPFATAYQEIEE